MAMVAEDGKAREHEQKALDLYLAAGQADAAVRARQALVLAVFLAGDYEPHASSSSRTSKGSGPPARSSRSPTA